jgi:D-alanyl-lipoteichoic acid acyltransferase DltB (MBOAT superfamily)
MNEYWRLWNIPIHSFLTRHVYFPLLRRGYSKQSALMVVFLFSALVFMLLIYLFSDFVLGKQSNGWIYRRINDTGTYGKTI